MSKNNNKPNSSELDFVSPLVDIMTIVIENIIELLTVLINFLITQSVEYINIKLFNKFPIRAIKNKELKSKKQSELIDSIGFSVNHKRSFKCNELNTKKHTAFIGSTGSGKTVCSHILIEDALRHGKPVIYFDPKASIENIETFKKICKHNNKKLYIFCDFYKDSTAFNPLAGGSLNDISDKIINALEWSEPFYKNESIEALDNILIELDRSNTPITLNAITEQLKIHRNFKNIKGLYNQLNKVNQSGFSRLLNSKESNVLNFNKLRTENACLYIGISAMGHSSSGSILNKIFFGGLLTHTKETLIGKVPKLLDPLKSPISVYFDELSSTIHEGFIDLQNKCRSAGIEITYATQGPSDIDRISPTLTAQIFENTNNLFIFNQVVPAHTEFFARMFGTVNSEKKTHVIEKDQKQEMGTVREVEEFVVHSNILRNLRVGQCILLQREPKRINLLNIRLWKLPNNIQQTEIVAPQAESIFKKGG
jgi:conjugal transfer pilus assembly protein TraD